MVCLWQIMAGIASHVSRSPLCLRISEIVMMRQSDALKNNRGHSAFGSWQGAVGSQPGDRRAPDKPMPIGEASCKPQSESSLAVWVPRIGTQEITGRWLILDSEFRPVE